MSIRPSHMCFSLRKDIFNHKDINCFSFFNNSDILFMIINVYSNNYQSVLKYLQDTEANLYNVLVMASDFNIRNSDWDLSYPFHLIYRNTLIDIADSFDLKLSSPIQQVPTWYSNNANNLNFIIDLIFLCLNFIEVDNHIIFPEL